MLSVRRPSPNKLREFVIAQGKLDFSYPAVGATAHKPPDGFTVDHTRVKLGEGERVFQAARAALRRWRQFDLGWVEVWPPEPPIRAGEVVAIVGRAVGVWWVSACKIVYAVDEFGPIYRFGLANGTLPGHAARGEERFLIAWDRDDDDVWYDILAFSRPNHLLSRLGYPLLRRMQKRFGRESAAAMITAVRIADEDARRDESRSES